MSLLSSDGRAAPRAGNSRRDFLLGAGLAAGGLAALTARADDPSRCDPPMVPMEGAEPQAPAYRFPRTAPTRVRKNVFEVLADKTERERLIDAFDRLKKLPKDDPRSWCTLANQHELHCSHGPGDRPHGQDAYHMQIHFGWYFLPWHRAYLYFCESILSGLVKDDSFALPYWDWTLHSTLPDELFDEKSPLFHAARDVKKGLSIVNDPAVFGAVRRETIEAVQAIVYFYSPAPGLTGSYGGPPDNDQSAGYLQGALESIPHNAIHNWVGGDMGSFDAAARDLVFFLHHANVDRLWAEWMLIPGHTNPSSSTWQTQWFNFIGPDGKEVSVTAGDVVDFMKVNVLYQPHQAAGVRLGPDKSPEERTLEGKPVTVGARVPLLAVDRQPKAPAPPRRTIRLAVEGFQAPADAAMRLHAFLNKPDADAATPLTDEHYVGTFFIVPMTAKAGMGMGEMGPPRVLNLDVTERAAALLGAGPVQVTLVPADRNGKANGAKVRFKTAAVVAEE
ncbi:MAG TPA: tyrosinase family protein [Gemmataceae bacterium]|nr:tyrosinase family protein [Gemmataceae bacterium]